MLNFNGHRYTGPDEAFFKELMKELRQAQDDIKRLRPQSAVPRLIKGASSAVPDNE